MARRSRRGNIRKKGKDTWQISVFLGRDEEGKQHRLWRTVRGNRQFALDELDRLLREVGTKPPLYREGHRVIELIREWMHYANLEETTRADYERVIATHLPPELAQANVRKVQPFDLDRLYATLRNDGVGAWRIRRLHTILRRSFAQAVRWQWLERNPATDASPPRPPKPDIHSPAPDAVRDAIAGAPSELKMWVRLAAATGARRGELCGLRWGDFVGDDVKICRSVAYTPKTGVYVKETKTHQDRTVRLDRATLAALEVYRTSRLATGPECYLFARDVEATDPWRPDSTGRAVSKLTGGAIHPHALRHFVATQLIAAGYDVVTVARRLGHEKPSTTMDMYSHLTDRTGQQAADHLASLLE